MKPFRSLTLLVALAFLVGVFLVRERSEQSVSRAPGGGVAGDTDQWEKGEARENGETRGATTFSPDEARLAGAGFTLPAAFPVNSPRDDRGRAFAIGPVPDLDSLFRLAPGERGRVSLPGGMEFEVTLRSRSEGAASVALGLDFNGGTVSLAREDAGIYLGHVIYTGHELGREIASGGVGRVRVTELPAKNLMCASWDRVEGRVRAGFPRPRAEGAAQIPPAPPGTIEAEASAMGAEPQGAPPALDSRPAATAVVYLDFDGQTVTGTRWNTEENGGNPIVAAPSTLTNGSITGVWRRVATDMAPFDISVTTIESRYLSAPQNRRIRVIITPTSDWYEPAGGVAYLNSFTSFGDTPCWVFEDMVGYSQANVSMVTTHEIGHTFGLTHDGRDISGEHEEYYEGHGSGATSWAPVMGAGYGRSIIQWSDGDYYQANEFEDDLAIISNGTNGFGYRLDGDGDTLGTATVLTFDQVTGTVSRGGVIERTTDVDLFRMNLGVGQITLTVSAFGPPGGGTEAPRPTLDLRAELLNSSGSVVQTSDPAGVGNASINAPVTGGTYYLRLTGVGYGNPNSSTPTGYAEYASLGEYWFSAQTDSLLTAPDLTPGSDSGISNSDDITNVTTPVFTGVGPPGEGNVTLISSRQGVIGTAPVSGSGAWTVTVSTPLVGGVHLITQEVGSYTESTALSVTIDTNPPNPPGTPDLLFSSDSGLSSSDNITQNTTPSFQVFAEVGSRLELLVNGLPVASDTVPSWGWLTLDSSALTDGTWPVTARATDVAGNVSAFSSALNVVIDTAPPPAPPDLLAVSDTGISGSDDLTSDVTPDFLLAGAVGERLDLMVDGVSRASGTVPAGGTLTFTSPSLEEGTRQIGSRATDRAGNVGPISAVLPVVIDVTPPHLIDDIRLDPASDSGLSNSDRITNIVAPVVVGVTEGNSVVELFIDGVPVGTHPAGGTWSIPAPVLAEGNRMAQIRVRDAAGNLSPLTSPSVAIVIDTIAPGVPTGISLTSATDTGRSQGDEITRLTNPVIEGDADPGSRVQVRVGGNAVGFAPANGSGDWLLGLSGLTQGIHQISARQTDAAGNVGIYSPAVPVEVDLTPPEAASAPLLLPSSDTGASNSDRITRQQRLDLAGTAEPLGRVTLVADGINAGTGNTDASGNWTLTSNLLAEGVRSLRVRAEDLAGNVTGLLSPATEVTIVLSAQPPTNFRLDPESDLGSSNSDGITSDTAPWLTGDAPVGSVVEISSGPPTIISLGSGPGGTGWRIKSGAILPGGDGLKTVRARLTDIAGNVSGYATTQIDIRTANLPAPIGLTLSPGSDNGVSTSDRIMSINTPRFFGLANFGSLTGIRLRLESDAQVFGLKPINSGFWEIDAEPIPDGVHQIRARLEDFAGNMSPPSGTVTITVDTRAPAPPFNLGLSALTDTGVSQSDGLTNLRRPEVVGMAEPGAISLEQDGIMLPGAVSVDSEGHWSFQPPADLPIGETVFRARQSDLAGNQGDFSSPLSVVVDIDAPEGSTAPALDPGSDLGILANDRVTSQSFPEFVGTASAGDMVVIFADGEAVGTGVADESGHWVVASELLGDGEHAVTASLTDQAGNFGPASPSVTVLIDSAAPTVMIAPAPGQSSPTLDEPIRVTVSFSEPVWNFQSSGLSLGGPVSPGAVATVVGNAGDTEYLVEISGTSGEGDLTVEVNSGAAIDLAGNGNLASSDPPLVVVKKLPPGVVEGVAATGDLHPDKVEVTWQPLDGADIYRIFRHAFPNPAAATQIGEVGEGVTSFDDTDAVPGAWYSYWVRAEDEDGVGPWGTAASGRAQVSGDSDLAATPKAEAEVAELETTEWDEAAVGVYEGLLRDAANPRELVGVVENLRIAPPRNGGDAPASALVRLLGQPMALRGTFAGDGRLTGGLRQRDGTRWEVTLQQMTDGRGARFIRGTVSGESLVATVELEYCPHHPRLAPVSTDLVGSSTLLFPAAQDAGAGHPKGDGWATAKLTPAGAFLLNGQLGDGTRFAESARLTESGAVALHTDLYRSRPERGRVGGRLVFRDQPTVSDFDGVMSWVKHPDTRERLFPDGFEVEMWALGSHYTPPLAGQRTLAVLEDSEPNARLRLIGPGLPEDASEILRVISWQSRDQLRHYGPEKLAARVSRPLGRMSGGYFDPATRARVAFTGVVFQKQQMAAGCYLGGSGSGALRVLPGTEYAFPGSEDPGEVDLPETPSPPVPPDLLTLDDTAASDAVGNYGGLLRLGDDISGAIERVKLSPSGVITGILWIDGERQVLRGRLGETISFSRKGADPGQITLSLVRIDPAGGAASGPGGVPGFGMVGTATVEGDDHAVEAARFPRFAPATPVSQAGAHTLVLLAEPGADPALSPAGSGHATLNVSIRGTVKGLMLLADGQRFSLSGQLGRVHLESGMERAEWTFHRGLYGRVPRGFLAGRLDFIEDEVTSELSGNWRWVKQTGAAPAAIYPNGFDLDGAIVGGRYTAPARGVSAFPGLADDWHNVWLRWALPVQTDRAASWPTTNRVIYFGPEILNLAVNVRSGLVTGRWRDRNTGLNLPFSAVLLQDQQLAVGSCLWQGQSGGFTMQPR